MRPESSIQPLIKFVAFSTRVGISCCSTHAINALVQAVRQGGDKLERLDDLGLRSRSSSANLLQTKLYRRNDRTLLRTYRDGQSKIDGFTDDFAFLIQGLIDLYEASFDTRWLDLAGTVQERLKQWWTDGLDISA